MVNRVQPLDFKVKEKYSLDIWELCQVIYKEEKVSLNKDNTDTSDHKECSGLKSLFYFHIIIPN